MKKSAFKLGAWLILPAENAIQWQQENKESLQPKFIEVLVYLAQQYPRVIARQELIEHIWAGNEYVGEKALTNAIWHLRKKFAENTNQEEAIATIRKVGYKLNLAPQWLEPESSSDSFESKPTDNPSYIRKTPLVSILFVLLLLIVGYGSWHQLTEHHNDDKVVLERITTDPGTELFASPSPDGRFVVYKWTDASGESNLFIKDTSQPQLAPRQITFDGRPQGISAWSPDGIHLYFARRHSSTEPCEIVQLNTLAQQESVITQCPRSGGYYYLDVSHDGKTLAFHGNETGEKDSGIYFIRLDQQNAEPVRFSCRGDCNYKDRDMAFSPDGQWLALSRRTNKFSENIFLLNLVNAEEVQITNGEEDIVGITWHPNSDRLVYATQQADIRQGYVYHLATKEIEALGVTGFSYPEFAKKSASLYFQQRRETYHIASIQLKTNVASTTFPIIQSSDSHLYPDYSAVTDKIVYVSNESGNYELWQASSKGKERIQLTQIGKNIRYPKWSPDGNKIAFLAPDENAGGEYLYILDLATNRVSLLNTRYHRHNRPTWTLDGRHVISTIYTKDFADLFKISVSSGEAIRVTYDNARFGYEIQEGILLYAKTRGGLWQKGLDESQESNPVISSADFAVLYSWLPTETGVYYRHQDGEITSINYFNFAQNATSPVFNFPYGVVSSSANLSYIPSQDKLIFPQSSLPQADIKRLNHPLLK